MSNLSRSCNVFRDIGFPEEEAQNLALRSDLMIRIQKLVQESGTTSKRLRNCLASPNLG